MVLHLARCRRASSQPSLYLAPLLHRKPSHSPHTSSGCKRPACCRRFQGRVARRVATCQGKWPLNCRRAERGCPLPHTARTASPSPNPSPPAIPAPYHVGSHVTRCHLAGALPSSTTPYPTFLFKSYPGLHALSNPPQHAPPHAPYHTAALAWQWGGTKLPCSAVLVLLVGCLLPGGGALSTSPAAPTTAASLEGSSGSTSASPSPGRGLSDSMTNRKWLQ